MLFFFLDTKEIDEGDSRAPLSKILKKRTKQKIKAAYNFGNNVRLVSLYFRNYLNALDYAKLQLKSENSIKLSSCPL